jgi:hypothetical protein
VAEGTDNFARLEADKGVGNGVWGMGRYFFKDFCNFAGAFRYLRERHYHENRKRN